jgi:hypothetical protein
MDLTFVKLFNPVDEFEILIKYIYYEKVEN